MNVPRRIARALDGKFKLTAWITSRSYAKDDERKVVVLDETTVAEAGASARTSEARERRGYTPRYRRDIEIRRVMHKISDWERANEVNARTEAREGSGKSKAAVWPTQAAMKNALSIEVNREITTNENGEGILEHIRSRGHEYNMVNCATAWHRLAKMFRMGRLPRTWRAVQDKRVEELEAISHRLLETFAVQNLSNMVWSCAVLGYRPRGDLLGKAADEMEKKVEGFYPQALTNTLWAYATLKHPRAVKLAQTLAPAMLATLPKNEVSLTRAENATEGQFSTQAVSNALWTYASLGVNPGVELLDGLASWVSKNADTFKSQELSNAAWSYAQLGHHPGDSTLSALERCLLERKDEYTTQALANSSIGLAYFGGSKDGGLKTMFNAVTPSTFRLSDGNSQDLSNLTWAIAAVGAFESLLYKAAVRQLFRRDAKEFAPEGLKMIFHAMLMQKDFDPDRSKVDVVYPDWVNEDARKAWLTQTTETRVSTFQQQVALTIKGLGVETVMEHTTEDEVYSMDICILDKKVAIECDGPSHYYTNLTSVPTQKTVLRNRALAARGWKVVVVPYYIWHDEWSSSGARAYIGKLLRDHGALEWNE